MDSSSSLVIGIRRESEAKYEARVPLTPARVRDLSQQLGSRVRFILQPSQLRAFSDDEYRAVGVTVREDLAEADIIACVKEVYPTELIPGKIYLVFAHVMKGQPDNMPVLRELLAKNITLIDYECIRNERGARTVFFGRSAGQAGMFETLRAFGNRRKALGSPCLLDELKPIYRYKHLAEALAHLQEIARELAAAPSRLGTGSEPVVFAFAGLGNVGQGALEVFTQLPHRRVAPQDLAKRFEDANSGGLVALPLQKHQTLQNASGHFDAAEYRQFPERYCSALAALLPYISVFVNCVFWSSQLPRLLPKDLLQETWKQGVPRLQVVGDLSCDPPAGSMGCATQAGDLYHPTFGYDPRSGEIGDAFAADMLTVMAVDNLCAGLPVDSSREFGEMLGGYIPTLVSARLAGDRDWPARLPPDLANAVICHGGVLRSPFAYLSEPLARYGSSEVAASPEALPATAAH